MEGTIEKKIRRLNQLNERVKAKDSIKFEVKKYKIKQEFQIFKKKLQKRFLQMLYNYFIKTILYKIYLFL